MLIDSFVEQRYTFEENLSQETRLFNNFWWLGNILFPVLMSVKLNQFMAINKEGRQLIEADLE